MRVFSIESTVGCQPETLQFALPHYVLESDKRKAQLARESCLPGDSTCNPRTAPLVRPPGGESSLSCTRSTCSSFLRGPPYPTSPSPRPLTHIQRPLTRTPQPHTYRRRPPRPRRAPPACACGNSAPPPPPTWLPAAGAGAAAGGAGIGAGAQSTAGASATASESAAGGAGSEGGAGAGAASLAAGCCSCVRLGSFSALARAFARLLAAPIAALLT
jgi:hypothetical protein